MPERTTNANEVRRPSKGIRYMPELDGLRAIAVLAVLFYHIPVVSTQGGFFGVTVFFVLSGFLIARLLIKEFFDTETISFKSFYIRRVRRLIPAILLLIIAVGAICTLFNHVLLTKMRPDVLSSLFFFNNWWQIAQDASYFESLGPSSPLEHFWSLSIEEQFYLVMPAFLLLALKRGWSKKGLLIVLGVLTLASAAEMALLYNPDADPTRIYYGTDTRAFSLLMGVMLAVATTSDSSHEDEPKLGSTARLLLGTGGVLGIVALCLFTNSFTAFQFYGGHVLVSALTCVVIYATMWPGGAGALSSVLASSPLVWLGKRSYGIYLWHYPIILLLTPQNAAEAMPAVLIVLAVALSIIVPALSYKFVEEPLRRGRRENVSVATPRTSTVQTIGTKLGATFGGETVAKNTIPASIAPGPNAAAHNTYTRAGRPLTPFTTGLVSVMAVVLVVGIMVVPETSVLSEAGAALLDSKVPSTENGEVAGAIKETPQTASQDKNIAWSEDGVALPDVVVPYSVLLLGDSVSIRAIPYFEETFPEGHIDGEMNRRLQDGIAVYDKYETEALAGKDVVFALGTNGLLTDEILDAAADAAGPDRNVYFLTVRNNLETMENNNSVIAEAAARHNNVYVIDWFAESAGRSEYFDGDGTHLSEEGAQAWVSMVKNAIEQVHLANAGNVSQN